MPSSIPAQGKKGAGPARGNSNALKTGHAQALRALEKDGAFSALAQDKQDEIETRLSISGLPSELRHRAVRTATVADLFFDALVAKWDDLDIEKKMKLTDAYSRLDTRAIRNLKDAGDLENKRKERQFPDLIDVAGEST